MKKTLKSNFKDKRGRIIDIFVKNPKDHCSLVTLNKGAIRGNHFHKKSVQSALILDGVFEICDTGKVEKGVQSIKIRSAPYC